ncbi:MAG: acetyl-CoA carboxylase biotin carboxylase subunit [Anaerolineae bacterium]|nr:acetyl-CoA carboxylase biotin carboxylase subunit [Anaerolineae bacterium]
MREIRKVLVANRGEIAARIIRACRDLGLQSVAVYSDVDRGALHVRYADEAYPIGPAPPRESYGNLERIMEVAVRAGVDALHPGYGFLAEDPRLALACEDAGIRFVGPRPETIALMGNKIAARQKVATAGVPVAPGTDKALDDAALLEEGARLGFPLVVKAAFGWGYRGLHFARDPGELAEVLVRARREARSRFGNDSLLLEKAIPNARHVEVTLMADHAGQVVHLYDHESSIQVRMQKVIEEAPSLALDEAARWELCHAALRVAQIVGYRNVGTVEFLLDQEGKFYFLGMNCRLQVEHPVTEMVTGVDLVEAQLRIAAGEPLPVRQEEIQVRGHAIECRILAQDPSRDFAPSLGTVHAVHEPVGPGVRVESGIYRGAEVGPYYDPLLAKVIVWGATRQEAIQRMQRALEEFRILGVTTNIPFHQRVLASSEFRQGRFSVWFGEEPRFRHEAQDLEAMRAAAVLAALLTHRERQQASLIGQRREARAWRVMGRWGGMRK